MVLGSRKALLLVEDEPLIAMSEKLTLESCGYSVETARTGEAAVDAIRSGLPVDLVLMDVDLGPGIDGPTAARRVLELRELPVVFLSSHTEPEIVRSTEMITSYGYVVKNSGITVLDASIKMAFKLFEANAGLTDREGRYRSLYSNMVEGAALHELIRDESGAPVDYRILDVNAAFESQLGIPRSLVVGKTSKEAYAVPDPPYLGIYAKVAETGEAVRFETFFPAMAKHLSISAYSPGPGLFATIFEDVTERKANEAIARESEIRFREIVEGSGAGYFFIDAEGLYRRVNRAWLDMHGYEDGSEILGRHFSVTQVDADEATAAEVVRSIMRGTEVLNGEFTRRRKDGTIGWHSYTIRPVRETEGSVAGMEGFLIDATREREAEGSLARSQVKLRALLSASDELVCEVDAEGNYSYLSDNYERILGYRPEELLGRKAVDHIHPEDLAAAVEKRAAALGRMESTADVWRFRGKSGGYRRFECRGSSYPAEDGTTRTVVVAHEAPAPAPDRADEVRRLTLLVDLLQHRSESVQEFLDFALGQALELTGSRYGYIYFYDEESREFILNTWSRDVMGDCSVIAPQTRYELDKTGIWGEAVRQRRPIVVNDFASANPLKRGYPEGHVALDRFMTLPLVSGGRIVAVVGLANKAADYHESDVLQTSLLMDATWKVIERMRALEEVRDLLAEKERILKEVHHRIKNNMNAIQGVILYQSMATRDPSASTPFPTAGRDGSASAPVERTAASSSRSRTTGSASPRAWTWAPPRASASGSRASLPRRSARRSGSTGRRAPASRSASACRAPLRPRGGDALIRRR